MIPTILQVLGGVSMAVGLPAVLMFIVKERRKNRAASEIAERTVDADVVMKDTAADDARLLHAIAAFDAERASYRLQLEDRDREIDRQRTEIVYRDRLLEHRDEVIAQLRDRVEELLTRLGEATRELHTVRLQLAELAAEVEHEKNPNTSPARGGVHP